MSSPSIPVGDNLDQIMMLEKEAAPGEIIAMTRVGMKNGVPDKLKLIIRRNFSGRPTELPPFPAVIEKDQDAWFQHWATSLTEPNGSMGCVVYSGKNNDGVDCAWLMAWHNPHGDVTRKLKVYVETGLAALYQPGTLDFERVKNKLKSSSDTSHFEDQSTRAKATAEISVFGKSARIDTVFNLADY